MSQEVFSVRFIPRVAPGFPARLQEQHTNLRNLSVLVQDEAQIWGDAASLGDYGESKKRLPELTLDTLGRAKLTGVELQLKNQILAFQEVHPNQTIINLDVGGMVGLSWIKLATHFREEIAGGTMAFVVSNIAFDHTKGIEQLFEQNPELRESNPELNNFIQEHAYLVHFIHATMQELGKQEIEIPTKGKMQLHGNVSLLHEVYATSHHSQIPEWDLSFIPDLLIDGGKYLVLGAEASNHLYKNLYSEDDILWDEEGDRAWEKAEKSRLQRDEAILWARASFKGMIRSTEIIESRYLPSFSEGEEERETYEVFKKVA